MPVPWLFLSLWPSAASVREGCRFRKEIVAKIGMRLDSGIRDCYNYAHALAIAVDFVPFVNI